MSIKTYVNEIPACDLCAQDGRKEPAAFDAKTSMGPWAHLCEEHFSLAGLGLGTGVGQRLVLRTRDIEPDEQFDARLAVAKAALMANDYGAFEEAVGDSDPIEFLDRIAQED